jgi:hypothetical protein
VAYLKYSRQADGGWLVDAVPADYLTKVVAYSPEARAMVVLRVRIVRRTSLERNSMQNRPCRAKMQPAPVTSPADSRMSRSRLRFRRPSQPLLGDRPDIGYGPHECASLRG